MQMQPILMRLGEVTALARAVMALADINQIISPTFISLPLMMNEILLNPLLAPMLIALNLAGKRLGTLDNPLALYRRAAGTTGL